MNKRKQTLIHVAVLATLGFIGTAFGASPPVVDKPADPVVIVGPLPLPITGSTTVSGSVAATQSGAWNVGITGPLPPVSGSVAATQSGVWNVGITGALPPVSVPGTVTIGDVVVPAGSIDQGFFFDGSPYKEIRIVGIEFGSCASNNGFTVTVWLFDDANTISMRLDQYPTGGANETTKVYDVVAKRMAYTAKTSCDTRLIAFGRTN